MPDERSIAEVVAEVRRDCRVGQHSSRDDILRLCDEIERMTRMLEVLPGLIEEMQTYAGDDEVIVLTQSSYNQLREDAGWPVVWSDKKPKDVQAWRGFMKGGE